LSRRKEGKYHDDEISRGRPGWFSADGDGADAGRCRRHDHERQLNPQREPQNWILHHGNYQGHRFSLLKEINTDTVKNMKPVFTVALSGFQSGGRYGHGNLEATPLVEDGTMYLPDGWGSVYAIDVSAGKKGVMSSGQQPCRRTLNPMFAANHLGLRNGCLGTVIGERVTQSREVNVRLARVLVNHGGILKVLAEDEMRFKQAFVKLRKSAWLTLPGPLGSS
jgi:hypothetical protein